MALRKRFSFSGFAMLLRSGLLPWNAPAHAKVRQCTVPIRAWLTSDLTYREVHDVSRATPGTMIQARIGCLTLSERILRLTAVPRHARQRRDARPVDGNGSPVTSAAVDDAEGLAGGRG